MSGSSASSSNTVEPVSTSGSAPIEKSATSEHKVNNTEASSTVAQDEDDSHRQTKDNDAAPTTGWESPRQVKTALKYFADQSHVLLSNCLSFV